MSVCLTLFVLLKLHGTFIKFDIGVAAMGDLCKFGGGSMEA